MDGPADSARLVTPTNCGAGLLCAPVLDLEITPGTSGGPGYRICVPPGSVQDHNACDFIGAGAQQCASGICDVVEIHPGYIGVGFEFGMCGECEGDEDCDRNGDVCKDSGFYWSSGPPRGPTPVGTPYGSYCELP